MRDCSETLWYTRRRPMLKILVKFDTVKFDQDLRRIRVNFAQKPPFNANNSFKPVCYGLVQRRWKSRRG